MYNTMSLLDSEVALACYFAIIVTGIVLVSIPDYRIRSAVCRVWPGKQGDRVNMTCLLGLVL